MSNATTHVDIAVGLHEMVDTSTRVKKRLGLSTSILEKKVSKGIKKKKWKIRKEKKSRSDKRDEDSNDELDTHSDGLDSKIEVDVDNEDNLDADRDDDHKMKYKRSSNKIPKEKVIDRLAKNMLEKSLKDLGVKKESTNKLV